MPTILEDLTTRDPKTCAAKPDEFIEPRFVKELDAAGHIRRLHGQ